MSGTMLARPPKDAGRAHRKSRPDPPPGGSARHRIKDLPPRTDGRFMLGTRPGQLPDCRPLLADPDDLTLVFQPIVDLAAATVAGYEAVARFPGTAGPDVWFAAAADVGVGAELAALAVHRALAAVPGL